MRDIPRAVSAAGTSRQPGPDPGPGMTARKTGTQAGTLSVNLPYGVLAALAEKTSRLTAEEHPDDEANLRPTTGEQAPSHADTG